MTFRFRTARTFVLACIAGAALTGCAREDAAGEGGLTTLGPVGADGSGEAQLTTTPAGDVVLSWIEPHDDVEALRYAVLRDGAWSAPVTVVERADLFVNWADLPSVVKLGEDRWVAHYLVSQPDSYAAYDIEYVTSSDGRAWSEPARLNTDTSKAEHGFVTLFDWGGELGAVWLDGRRLAAAAEGAASGEPSGNDAGAAPVGTELRYARIEADGTRDEGVIDELACDCCKTAVAATPAGPVLAYRDRTPDEIRDIVVRRVEGSTWTAPQRVAADGWRIEGCPVNGPAIAARGDSVAVAWFTGANNSPRVQLAWSKDAGRRFGDAIEVDAAGSFGQADVALLDADSAVVSWWRRGADSGIVLAARRVDRDGTLGPVREIATADLGQPLDVPQLERAGDGRLVFAWTAFKDSLQVHTAYAENWF